MIEARERFLLQAYRRREPLNESLWNAIGKLDFSGLSLPQPQHRLHHFEVILNPNEGTPPSDAVVTTMFEDRWHEYEPPAWGGDTVGIGAAGLGIMGQMDISLPVDIKNIVKSVFNDDVRRGLAPHETVGTIRDLFRGEIPRENSLLCGFGVPLDQAEQAVRIALGAYEEFGGVLPMLLSVRYVKGTRALLGFTRFPTTCVLGLDALNSPMTREYVRALWKRFEQQKINFTLDWDKFNANLTAAHVARMYGPSAVDQWKASRASLLESPEVSRVFESAFIRSTGLGT